MVFLLKASPKSRLRASSLIVLLSALTTIVAAASPAADASSAKPVLAQFRGCESAGWCRFHVESMDAPTRSLYLVYPDGVVRAPDDAIISTAVRDRLNALLAGMIHQHKRIVLHNLREVGDGMFAAKVTVNGLSLESDTTLLELQSEFTATPR